MITHIEKKLSAFPAFLKVAKRKIVIIGNGEAAFAKLRLLDETQAILVVVSHKPEPALQAYLQEKQGEMLVWIQKAFEPSFLDDAVLVFICDGQEDNNRQLADIVRAHHIPVNVVDQPSLCDFYTPALINRAPLIIAIGSEGGAPVLTQLVRAKIEALLCPSFGALVRLAAKIRTHVDYYVPAGLKRRLFWQKFFIGRVAHLMQADDIIGAEQEAEKLMLEEHVAAPVFLLNMENSPIDHLTLRAQQALLSTNAIVHDLDIDVNLLKTGRRDAHQQKADILPDRTIGLILEFVDKGEQVVRIYNKTSTMQEEIKALQLHNLAYEILPSLANYKHHQDTTCWTHEPQKTQHTIYHVV